MLLKTSPWWRRSLEIVSIVLLFFAIHAYQTRHAPTGFAPDIHGQLLDGTEISLEELRGQPVLVQFWATWCPVCELEQTSIDALADDYQVVSVAMDSALPEQIRRYMKDKQVDYPVIHDPDSRIAREYAVTGVPSSFVLDADGRIRFVEVGYTTGPGLRLRLWWAGH